MFSQRHASAVIAASISCLLGSGTIHAAEPLTSVTQYVDSFGYNGTYAANVSAQVMTSAAGGFNVLYVDIWDAQTYERLAYYFGPLDDGSVEVTSTKSGSLKATFTPSFGSIGDQWTISVLCTPDGASSLESQGVSNSRTTSDSVAFPPSNLHQSYKGGSNASCTITAAATGLSLTIVGGGLYNESRRVYMTR